MNEANAAAPQTGGDCPPSMRTYRWTKDFRIVAGCAQRAG